MELKVGILPPRSDMFPSLGKNLLDGFKLGISDLDPAQFSFQFRIEGIGNAADDGTIRIAEKMILQEEVDLLFSFCSSYLLERMVKVFDAYQKPLVHVDLGGNSIKSNHRSPYVAFHSLNVWQSAYAAGKYAAITHGKKAALAASFYDGAYQHTAALVKGFTDHGGTIVHSYVGPMDYKLESYDTMIQGIKTSEVDVTFLLFSYKEGDKVLHALGQSPLNGAIPFVALPLLTDESFYNTNHRLKELVSVASWSFDEALPEMMAFVQKSHETFQTTPNIMHLLGYELGQVVSALLQHYGNIPKNIVPSLQNLTISSPRGILNYNTYGESQVDFFKVRTFNFNKIRYHNTVITAMDTSFTEPLYAVFENLDYVGWQNPYICT